MIIALSGYAGAGKDTVADALVKKYGFTKYAWADSLRMAASALNPIVAWAVGGDEYYEGDGAIRYNDVIEQVGYNDAKFQFPEVRELLQRLGTEVGRELIGDNVWVDATLRRIERDGNLDSNIAITDCRFPNEAQAVKDRGGFVVRVTRPGIEAVNAHPSETSLDNWPFDSMYMNSGSLDDVDLCAGDLYDALKSSQ